MKKIERGFEKILLRFPEFGFVIFNWDIKVDNSISTMATNYKELVFNQSFTENMSENEVCGVLLHEIYHNIFLHPTELQRNLVEKNKDPELWTLALEQVVNYEVLALIKDYKLDFCLCGNSISPLDIIKGKEGIGYVYDPCFDGMDSYQVYKELEKKQDPKGKKQIDISNYILTGDVIPNESVVGDQEQREKIIALLEKMQKSKGNLPGGLNRLYGKLKSANTPWERILAKFVTENIMAGLDVVDYRKIDSRNILVQHDFYAPGFSEIEIPPVVICIDVSGSISDDEITRFISECLKIKSLTSNIKIITTDTIVQNVFNIQNKEQIYKIKCTGGGGTDFNNVFEYMNKMKEKPIACVFLTDGCATFPNKKPKYPVLWAITKGGNTEVPFGKVVHII